MLGFMEDGVVANFWPLHLETQHIYMRYYEFHVGRLRQSLLCRACFLKVCGARPVEDPYDFHYARHWSDRSWSFLYELKHFEEILMRQFYSSKGIMLKHHAVTITIEEKIQDSWQSFCVQFKYIEFLKTKKEELKSNAEKIAERYEEINDKHLEIRKRIEAIARTVHAPYQTRAEQNMKTELKNISKKTEDLQLCVEQTQAIHDFRKSQEQLNVKEETKSQPLYLNEVQRRVVHNNLKAMSKSIRLLKEKVDRINKTIRIETNCAKNKNKPAQD